MNDALSPTEVMINLAAALFLIPIAAGMFCKLPKLVMFGFLVVLFFFADSTYGELQTVNNLYSRGVGMYYFSLLNLALFVLGATALVKRLAHPQGPAVAPSVTKYFIAFVFLFSGHVVAGLMQGIELNVILGYNGILNVFNMMIFMYLVIMSFNSEKDIKQLLLFIIAAAALRAVFGGVRYAFMGGDTANPYRNFDGFDIKIYFFDIGDNFIAALAAFAIAWMLTSPQVRLSFLSRAVLLGLLALEIAVVALSYRRSGLLGLGLMFLFLLAQLPGKRKIFFAMVACVAISFAASIFFEQRLQFAGGGRDGILSSLLFDVAPSRGGIKDSRFYELYAAAQSVGSNWLFGLGTWGRFYGDSELLSYHDGNYTFVHSGFGHIILKAGVVGVIIFSCILGAIVRFYLRHRKSLVGYARMLADTGFAGMLFWFPTLLIGTPVIEYRTMQLIGLTLALPFVAVGMQAYQVRQYQYHYQHAAA
ncbi:O-antigen ligase family protein [Noviherbaspirillum aridicola]|uniref:O-antigen ligase-related domain-containing protein n=1 Tax=Noviherbaspirillum aridicola TaxID=2849687 RepID=A0ABQ4Q1H3_9BURK|nr:O-antigen ligase family protein [Noviherbaspirillum aridicola]GIZ51038.1 hypothetical protein NCCP691_10520 [Noviherbaspirillum aridicola]